MISNKLWNFMIMLCMMLCTFLSSCSSEDDIEVTSKTGTVSLSATKMLSYNYKIEATYSGDKEQVSKIGIRVGKTQQECSKAKDGKYLVGQYSRYYISYNLKSEHYFQGYVVLKSGKTITSGICKFPRTSIR